MGRWIALVGFGVALAVAPSAANARLSARAPVSAVEAQRAVERYAARNADGDTYAVDRCRTGVRRAKCRLREWGMSDDLPWIEGPPVPYEGEFTAVVRRVGSRLVVHLAGICDEHDQSPACDY